MEIFSDLDAGTWIATLGALAICAYIAINDLMRWRQKLPVRARLKRLFLWSFAVLCAAAAVDTYSDSSVAPRLSLTGSLRIIRDEYRGKGGYLTLACLEPCTKSIPLLDIGHNAAKQIATYPRGYVFSLRYLDEPNEMSAGIYASKIVDIFDSENGNSIYHFDASLHSERIGFLAADAFLFLSTGLLAVRLAGLVPDTEDDYENFRTSSDDATGGDSAEITSLGLNSSNDENASEK